MARIWLALLVLFLILLVLRALRIFMARLSGASRRGPAVHGEMVRDPICGTWIDRRLAIAGRRGAEWLPVCSEKCRATLEESRP
jgi:hypothetical protein